MDDSSWLGRLPAELIDMISGGNDGTMSTAEAEAYKLELVDERTEFDKWSNDNYFAQEFCMWYVLVFLCSYPKRSLKHRTPGVLISDICLKIFRSYCLNPVSCPKPKSRTWGTP